LNPHPDGRKVEDTGTTGILVFAKCSMLCRVFFPRSLSRALSARWGRPIGASCFPLRTPLPSLPRGPALPGAEPLPRAPLSLSVPWTLPVSSALPAPVVDRRVRTRARRRNSRPRRPPTRPSSLLEPCQRLHSLPRLISPSSALSRALPTLPDAAEDSRPLPRPSSSLETAPSHPELRPEVRHLWSCLISPISLCARPILASLVFGCGGPPRLRSDWPN
jgi:hypothetical protein